MAQLTIDDLILEQLRSIAQDIGNLKQGMRDIRAEMLSLRQQLHGMQGGALRQEKSLAFLSHKAERIESPHDLNDA